MQYIGLYKQIRRNNVNSFALLVAFPLLLLAMSYIFIIAINDGPQDDPDRQFLQALPFIIGGTVAWFLIAWAGHASFIRMATGSRPLERKENKRVYNLTENLCIAQGMTMPKLYIIEDDSLNAFASGIDQRSYSISLSRGIINKLDDGELEGVIAHELTHIRNRDVRVLVISIIFVGIFAFLAELAFRSLRFVGSGRKSSRDSKGSGAIILLAVVITAVAYFISILLRFGISRRREYLADAGSADMTRNPRALASALRKIEQDPLIEAVESRDVAQLFIDNPKPSHRGSSWDNMFATHPPIGKRIELLENWG